MSLGDRRKPERIEGETEDGRGRKRANMWRQLRFSGEKHKKNPTCSQSLQPSNTHYDSSQNDVYKNLQSVLLFLFFTFVPWILILSMFNLFTK